MLATTISAMSRSARPVNTGWANYLETHLVRLDWTNAYLADTAGLDRSLVGRWINGEAQPTVDSVRKVCDAIRRDIREGLVASGLLTRAELHRTGDAGKPELSMFNDDELIEELKGRLSGGPRKRQHHVTTFSEASGGVSADWSEQSGSNEANGPTAGRQPQFSA